MADSLTTSTAQGGLLHLGLGYLVDQSHSPLLFAAVVGVGDVLELSLSSLERHGRDVSPILNESQNRIVTINLYDPEPLSVQVIQHHGVLERSTEILGSGIGMGVLMEVRRTAKILGLQLTPMTEHFSKRLANEKSTVLLTYKLFRGDEAAKRARLAQVLRSLQDKHRRESSLLRMLL